MPSQLFDNRRLREAMAEVGTPLWAERCRKAMQRAISKEHGAEIDFRHEWIEFVEHRGWELLSGDDGKPFADYRAFALCGRPTGLGMTPAEFKRHCEQAHSATGIDPRDRAETLAPLAPHGNQAGENNSRNRDDNTKSVSGQGTNADYLTARIARDRPDILDRMKAGEYKSVHAAALEAGIVKKKVQIPLDPERASNLIRKHFTSKQVEDLIWYLTDAP